HRGEQESVGQEADPGSEGCGDAQRRLVPRLREPVGHDPEVAYWMVNVGGHLETGGREPVAASIAVSSPSGRHCDADGWAGLARPFVVQAEGPGRGGDQDVVPAPSESEGRGTRAW